MDLKINENDLLKYPATIKRAKELGELYYFTGVPCKNGHIGLRFTSSANCAQCIREKRSVVEENRRNRKVIRSQKNQYLAMAAFNSGKLKYMSSDPCPRGHFERWITTNNCVECNNENRIKRLEKAKWTRIKKIYGISKDEYDKIILLQKGLCPVCGDSISDRPHVDHDHNTGVVRGILCSRCNQGIGLFRENSDIFLSAIKYLEGKTK